MAKSHEKSTHSTGGKCTHGARVGGGALLWHWQIIFKYPPTWFAWLSTEQALKLEPSCLFLHILTGSKSGKIQSSPLGVLCFSLPLHCRGIHVFFIHAVFLSEVHVKHIHRHTVLCQWQWLFLVFRRAAVPLSQLLCQCLVSPSCKAYTQLDLIRYVQI